MEKKIIDNTYLRYIIMVLYFTTAIILHYFMGDEPAAAAIAKSAFLYETRSNNNGY